MKVNEELKKKRKEKEKVNKKLKIIIKVGKSYNQIWKIYKI